MQAKRQLIPIVLALTVLVALPILASAATELDQATQDALVQALNDERRAEATYRAVLDEIGEVRPFVHIVQAEQRHQEELLVLFEAYDLEPPADVWADREIDVPDTRQEACAQGVQSEKDNVALYDKWLETITQPDVKITFERLRRASQEHHLRAFERCAAGGGMGKGKGMGKGGGMQGMHHGMHHCGNCPQDQQARQDGPCPCCAKGAKETGS